MSDGEINLFYRPIIGKHSPMDFIKTGLSFLFIILCMSFLALYIHKSVEDAISKKSSFEVEFVNMLREDVYNKANNLILKAPDLVIDRILEFPISYDKLDMQGYILLDTHTGVKYMYIRNKNGIAITKYWTQSELEHIKGELYHQFDDIYKDRPLRKDLP